MLIQNKFRLALFVNANNNIGLGHIYRSKVLANIFSKNNVDITFISPSYYVQNIVGNSFTFLISPNYSDLKYKVFIENIFNKYNFNLVLFDLLENDLILHKFINKLNVFIVSVTSYEYNFNRFEDVIFFPNSEKLSYSKIQTTNKTIPFFSGPKYIIFRNEFNHHPKQSKTINYLPKIFISTGALDSFKLLPIILEAIEYIPNSIECYVVMNNLAITKEKVYQIVEESSKEIYILESITNISKYMRKCDIAIINGGTTRYELAIIGTPFIAISINETQFEITEKITQQNTTSVNLGIKENITSKNITIAINKLLKNKNLLKEMSLKLQNIFDIYGKERIVYKVIELYKGKKHEKIY